LKSCPLAGLVGNFPTANFFHPGKIFPAKMAVFSRSFLAQPAAVKARKAINNFHCNDLQNFFGGRRTFERGREI
jgi:hypothetical protein